MNWLPRNERGDYFSTADGRFDLMAITFTGSPTDIWLAIDADFGRTFRGTLDEAERWAASRVGRLAA